MSTPVAVAATVILLRPEHRGFSVFLVQRHRASAFMPNLWVFPGGRVEPTDAVLPPERTCGEVAGSLGHPPETERAIRVAALRETFEEAGLWLGEGALPEGARAALSEGAPLADVLARHDARADLGALRPWARWVTPEGESRRFDTAFLLAVADGERGRGGSHDAAETVDSGWFAPRQVLDAGLARMGLAPPTWWALTELAGFDTVEAVLSAPRDLRPVRPVLAPGPHGFGVALPGHPDHPEPGRPGLPTHIGLGPAGGWEART